ncbi:MAG: Adenosine/AMP kinase [Candidatus Methanohalarchaeum thermophilum]|uniref:Adenosine/AMP kinase n=1 Tax=Methanohalarchaeum thermophilum TaxID=1903181 RepID=A0A1Q6DXP6_METT1|nr:MAG: Adenosine/AMP kinase [Candidatus Methanohalarchaeum thermophilum]
MELKKVEVKKDDETNIIFGQSHFIKTVEDLYEVLSTNIGDGKFGLAFCEASGPKLVRKEGNDSRLEEKAAKNALNIGAGHSFIIHLKDCFPIQVLNQIKSVQEVVNIYAATANSLQVILTETDEGRGVLGVIDGNKPEGIEDEEDEEERIDFLKKINYKR